MFWIPYLYISLLLQSLNLRKMKKNKFIYMFFHWVVVWLSSYQPLVCLCQSVSALFFFLFQSVSLCADLMLVSGWSVLSTGSVPLRHLSQRTWSQLDLGRNLKPSLHTMQRDSLTRLIKKKRKGYFNSLEKI